jgi:predicted nucleic acid-binding Zn ribbon protein
MRALSNEQFLDSEECWKDDFKIQFVRINKDGSEWWKVWHNGRSVSCNSMLMAFKIANTAWERLNKLHLSIDHSMVLDKAAALINYSYERMLYYRWHNGAWHKPRSQRVKEAKAKAGKPVKETKETKKLEKRSERYMAVTKTYECPKCGAYEVEMGMNEELEKCIKCDTPIKRVFVPTAAIWKTSGACGKVGR